MRSIAQAPARYDQAAGLRVDDDPAAQPEHLLDGRRGEHVGGRAVGDGAAVAHRNYSIGVASGLVEVVQHEHDRPAVFALETVE